MSDNKKIIRLDENNKLVIENDNAVITSEGATSTISGKYEISYKDVEKLLVLINDKTLAKPVYSYGIIGPAFKTGTQIITSDEAVSIVLKEYDELKEKYNKLNTECYELRDRHMTMRSNFDNLLAKVNKHNKNSLFNKIKIDELK